MMRLALESEGYEIEEAADGRTGLELFADGSRFDVVVLDQKMPGMDGIETLKEIQKKAPGATVIMVTAFGSIELAVDAMKAGARDFLKKPLTPALLRDALLAAMAKSPPTREVRRPADVPAPPLPPGSGELWTVNGFFIRRISEPDVTALNDHRFLVRHAGKGPQGEVIVTIDPNEVTRIARLSGRQLPPSRAFWRQQAEHALMNHLFQNATLPPGDRLMVNRLSDDAILLAREWRDD
jgi:DNA-binding response OmpR family regulator